MTSKHLQYETSKTVMQYLDANLRYELAQQAPTLGSIEKIVPLQIQKLEIGDTNLVINETKYTFSVHRESLDGSKLVSELDCDYDEFGFPMYPGRVNVLPGDIDLREDRGLREQWKHDTVEYEMILKYTLLQLSAQPWYFLGRDRAIDHSRAQLAPFETRRNKTPLPYIPSLQLTVEYPDGKKRIQRAPYISMLYENMKKLSTDFFGSRGSLVQVGTLVIYARDFVLRFPVDLKVHVRNLKLEISSIYKVPNYSALSPVLTEPLNSLQIREAFHDFRNLEQDIVNEAKQLVIEHFWPQGRWLATWKTLKNQKVHLKDDLHGLTSEHFIQLIDHWIVEGKPVGSCYTFDMDSSKIRETVRAVKRRQEVIEKSRSSVTLPMKNGSKLVISSEIQRNASKGVLKMKVIRSRQ